MASLAVMKNKPVWVRDGRNWPNRECSRFIAAGGLEWHVQQAGSGPQLLLIHGTGSASHSWGGLFPLLAEHYDVLALDLPGHAFTSSPPPERLSLVGMAQAVRVLLRELGFVPELCIGHSAGAAILARMSLDGAIKPRALISLSGALLPLRGLSGKWFSPAAKLFAKSSLVPRFFARGAREDPRSVQRMIDGTGSRLSPEGVALYRMLLSYPGHIAAALNMMANWNLAPLASELPRLRPELLLVVFGNDGTVPPAEADRVRARMPQAQRYDLPGLGHLGHEEAPHTVLRFIVEQVSWRP
jgi:magnesium chelatase accessory protein